MAHVLGVESFRRCSCSQRMTPGRSEWPLASTQETLSCCESTESGNTRRENSTLSSPWLRPQQTLKGGQLFINLTLININVLNLCEPSKWMQTLIGIFHLLSDLDLSYFTWIPKID
jgi:hypothetical protein